MVRAHLQMSNHVSYPPPFLLILLHSPSQLPLPFPSPSLSPLRPSPSNVQHEAGVPPIVCDHERSTFPSPLNMSQAMATTSGVVWQCYHSVPCMVMQPASQVLVVDIAWQSVLYGLHVYSTKTEEHNPKDATPRSATPRGATPRSATPRSATLRGATPRGATSRGAKPRGATPRVRAV